MNSFIPEAVLLNEQPSKDHIVKKLFYTFFSSEHCGSTFPMSKKLNIIDRNWTREVVPVSKLLAPPNHDQIEQWLRQEESKWGKFHWYDEPLILGPRWALPDRLSGIHGYVILDGWHRLAAAVRDNRKLSHVFVGRLTADEIL